MRLFLLSLFAFLLIKHPGIKTIKFSGLAQGTSWHITYYAADSIVLKEQVDSIFKKIDSSLSLYKPYSLVSQFNRSRDGLEVDQHLNNVVKKAQEVFRKTGGLFDITVYPLTEIWGFGPKPRVSLPSTSLVNEALACVSTDYLYWEGNTLKKQKPCVQLDPNGIAQGYTVDVIADFFERNLIKDYVIEVGGEIRVKGRKPGNKKISVGIEMPGNDPDFSMISRVIYPANGAITTSGNYRRYYESGGKRVTHLLDPRTGAPLQNELISVTVFAKDAITADAYDNAIMAMGLIKGLAFIERHKNLAAHFIFHNADGTIGYTMSKRFKAFIK